MRRENGLPSRKRDPPAVRCRYTHTRQHPVSPFRFCSLRIGECSPMFEREQNGSDPLKGYTREIKSNESMAAIPLLAGQPANQGRAPLKTGRLYARLRAPRPPLGPSLCGTSLGWNSQKRASALAQTRQTNLSGLL